LVLNSLPTKNGNREQFDRCWPWLEAARDYGGYTHTKEQVWEAIEDGRAQFWPLPNAAIMTTVDEHPTGFKELQQWLAGGDLNEILQCEPLICQWAKEIGCNRASIVGRRGWKKFLPEYRELATVFAKEL
jgi:hypothetical protein